MIEQGLVQTNESKLLPLTYELVEQIPLVIRAYWGDEQGNFIYSQQESDGRVVNSEIYNRNKTPPTRTLIYRNKNGAIIKTQASTNLSYDPRVRPWYLLAKKNKKSTWSDTYSFYHTQDIGTALSTPVYKNGDLYGVFGLVLNLNYLKKIIMKQQITENGFSFIATKNGELIAYPDIQPFNSMNHVKTMSGRESVKALRLIEKTLKYYNQSGKTRLTFPYKYNKETYMVSYEWINPFKDYHWVVGVIVPKSDFTVKLRRLNELSITLCLIILVLGIYLVSVVTKHIVKPIKILVKDTEEIKQFNLDHEMPISSNIKEIIQLKNAMNSMKIGLKLFQKYIPRILVRVKSKICCKFAFIRPIKSVI